MRITNGMMARRSMKDIEDAYKKLSNASYSFSTGKKYENAYDDPVSANTLSRLKSDRKDITKYYSNIDNATSAISDMETAVKDINSCMQKIMELFSNANNATLSASAKESLCQEVQQYKEQIITDLNYSSSGIYIFGGFNTRSKPITFNAGGYQYNGTDILSMTNEQNNMALSEKVMVNISKGMSMDIRISALELIGAGEDNMLSNIDAITNVIRAEEFDSVAFTELNTVFDKNYDKILMSITKAGAAANRIDSVKSQLSSRSSTLNDRISDIEDIDTEKAILNYKLAEQAYEATLSASASTIQLSLLDFLR
ncbi:MAG: flagellin [Clostridia bacterium]|jgi:flagellar hook-associated protein 3 FlgL